MLMKEEKAEESHVYLEPEPGYDDEDTGENKNQKAKARYAVYKRGGGRRSVK